MLRSEEQEAAFWEDMKNTNVKKPKKTFENSDDMEVDDIDNSGKTFFFIYLYLFIFFIKF